MVSTYSQDKNVKKVLVLTVINRTTTKMFDSTQVKKAEWLYKFIDDIKLFIPETSYLSMWHIFLNLDLANKNIELI
jgi:hypothetical protein